ncbi:MAG: tetratricopeptide repeat protein [Candidatus Cloacimonadota bacterium]|nr:tetratricopeptide repeat protein [Candidatus Cloacimonadota bacterium]
MKKVILLIILFFINLQLLAGYDISKANNAYQNQEYEKARDSYEELVKKGIKNFNLFYNLGNTYFKLENYGFARLFYEKALKFRPLDKDLIFNLELLKSRLKDKEETKETFLSHILKKMYYFLSINMLAIFVLICFILIMFTIVLVILANKSSTKRVIKVFMVILSILFMIFLIFTVARLHEFHNKDFAVIIDETVFAYSGPSKDFQQVFTIHEGLKIKIERFDKNWVLIKLQSGNGGWIEKDRIKII